ncbi:MAG: phage tail length tape measure family protein [Geminicoccaceae bacterium]
MADRDISLRLAVTDAEASIRRLREFEAQGDQALGRIASASKPASAGLTAVDQSSIALQGTMARLVPALATFDTGLAGLAAGGILALGAGLAAGVRNAEAAERSLLRLDGVLKATGGSAGLTAREITALGDQMERSTLAGGEAVVDAAAALATFKSVSGDTFTDAIRLSQDLAAVFGGDLTSTASQLGKALEDPVRGLESLREKGVTFSAAQREVIKSLVETGDKAEAQRQILEADPAARRSGGGRRGARGRRQGDRGRECRSQGQILAGLVAGRQAEADAIDEVKAARERLARLEDDRRRRIEDRGFDPSASVADFGAFKAGREADQAREAERMAAVFIRPRPAAQARAVARLRALR